LIGLAEVKVAYRQAGTVYVHREIDLGATGKVFDVTVTTCSNYCTGAIPVFTTLATVTRAWPK